MEDNVRWGRGILITRLLLFLGILAVMILLAGILFSRGDGVFGVAKAQGNDSEKISATSQITADSILSEPAIISGSSNIPGAIQPR